MSFHSSVSSRPADSAPRTPLNPVQRYQRFGPIRPMQEDRSLLERILFG